MKLIDKDALVAEIEKLQSEIAEEKKLHEDNSMWYNGINHGFNLTKDILNTLEVKDLQEEPVSIDFEQELYKAFGQVKDFTLGMQIAKWFYDMGKNSQEPVSEEEPTPKVLEDMFNAKSAAESLGISQEEHDKIVDECIYGKEPVSEDLEEAAMSYGKSIVRQACDELREEYGGEYTPGEDNVLLVAKYFKAGAKWQKVQMMKDAEDLVVGIDANGLACVNVDGVLPDDTVRVLVIKEN